MDRHLEAVSHKYGIHFEGVDAQLQRGEKERGGLLAMDAQPELVTMSNSGIPAFLSTFIDPKTIQIAITPNKATKIVGLESKKGDWTLETAMFPVVEYTGVVSSYGDYSKNGVSGANVNWVQRQSYTYQTFFECGERELEKMGLARISFANEKRNAAVSTLDKFQNKTYFFGVEGLANYGLLNDPSLVAPIAPVAVTGSAGSVLVTWAQKGTDTNAPQWVYNDVRALYQQLVSQANGIVELNMESPMTLALSTESQMYLTYTNPTFATNVIDMLKKNFPNLKVEVAVEYGTASGNLVQLIVDEYDGVRTATTAFTEKLRAHRMVYEDSSYRQKMSQGSWGTIISRPVLIASMLGV